jgi:hypothetical protein
MTITPMSEWIAIAQWADCRAMQRPGIVFEIQNAEGQVLLTRCIVPLPTAPLDWKSPPIRFRAVKEPQPEHSSPIPPPKR